MSEDRSSSHDDPTQLSNILVSGQRVGRYVIREKVATGGMGDIYLAHDTDLDRLVILKFILPHLCQSEECLIRFHREAQAAARLNHSNIVTIYEVGEHDRRPFIAMERIVGQTLAELLESGPLPVARVLDLAREVADALAEAHASGVIHRDIKPANIMITEKGHVKLADFGLASVFESPTVTRPGAMIGTPRYMSPEQMLGQSIDHKSDLFSLGIVLYEMVAGHAPFRGVYQAAVAYAIVNEEPPSLDSVKSEVPPLLAELVQQLLAKKPELRPRSAAEVRDRIDEIAGTSEPSQTSQTSPRSRLVRSLAMVLLAVVIGFSAPYFFRDESPSEKEASGIGLAVLPLRTSGESGEDYFTDGITAEITSQLAGLGGLRVIAPSSARQYKESSLSYSEIGSELNVAYILAGTFQWVEAVGQGNRLQIDLELVRTIDGRDVWSKHFTGIREEIIRLQSEITENVAKALDVAVSQNERRRLAMQPTTDIAAYDFYLRGNTYFNRSWAREDIMIAINMYEKSISLDSTFAPAFAMLARGEASMYWEYYDRSAARCLQAVRMADQAIALDPNLAGAHLARGYCYYHCDLAYDSAMVEFQRGLACDPNSADLYNAVAAVQRRQGKLIEAASNFIAAYTLDPRSYLRSFDVALTFGMLRDYPEAFAHLDSTIQLNDQWAMPYIYKAWLYVIRDGSIDQSRSVLAQGARHCDIYSVPYFWWLSRIVSSDYEDLLAHTRPGSDTVGYLLHRAQIFRLLNRPEDERRCGDSARAILESRLHDRPEDARFHSQYSLACAALRLEQLALEHGRKAVELLPASREAFDAPLLLLNLVEVLVIFERYDDAIDQLEYLTTLPGFVSPAYLRVDPLWRPLSENPRFERLTSDAI